ncbi:MAG: DUF4920 domain-containing protein [Flavobacteriaceae bacterium]
MKSFNVLVALLVLILSCHGQEAEKEIKDKAEVFNDYRLFGASTNAFGAISGDEMMVKYSAMGVTDTVHAKFSAKVISVCQTRGCWMKLALKDGQETMVRFKDYEFFMPKDIAGQEVIVDGFAFVEEMKIKEQKHYAKDGGASEEEITMIKLPKKTYTFVAEGVLLKE